MSAQLSSLLPLYKKHSHVKALLSLIHKGLSKARADMQSSYMHIHCKGLQGSSAAMVFAAMAEKKMKADVAVFVLQDEEEAGYFYHDLCQMLGHEDVLFYPSSYKRAVKYGQRDTANEVLRTQTLNRLGQLGDAAEQDAPHLPLVVTYPAALSEQVAAAKQLTTETLRLKVDETYDLPELEHRLLDIGFKRTDYVYAPGEFAVRGSILDVYSYSSEYPYRIDFFGDEIDTIRTFEVQTQLSKEQLKRIDIVPNVEESDELVDITHYFTPNTLLVAHDKELVYSTIDKIYAEGFSRQARAATHDKELEDFAYAEEKAQQGKPAFLRPKIDSAEDLDKQHLLVDGQRLRQKMDRLCYVQISASANLSEQSKHTIAFDTLVQPSFHKNFDLVAQSFKEYIGKGYSIYICADSEKQNERIRAIFDEKSPSLVFHPIHKTLHSGYVDHDLEACFFTDHQIFDRFHKYNLKTEHTRDAKMALTLKELRQFEHGDFVVHMNHGIGKFAGLVRMPGADGTMQEMIKLVYQNEDLVFVSIHSLHKLSKYKGKEGVAPKLSRLGTGAWERMKETTKKKIKDIARDLIRLYSQRKEQKGVAFSPDTYIQKELEASFTYEDTPDQLKVTQEVKADMESDKPMDRLVCGDVGFGKTEIAIRAAMKAATDGKQVAVLVPTTVLALQHFKTFRKRLKDFPVRIDYLSRARSAAQTRQVIENLKEGKIDIIIGTHKLINKSVRFKDLGLLIIDEEQKFGVAVKEKLRQLKTNIDTLTLSATPIPRTLQFSLMGARDFSVISTPPPNRRPIQTEIHPFSGEVIADAINFEMSRNGQVYIVSNRIAALGHLRDLIRKYVPDARVAIGHGQMSPVELEKTITGFVNYDYDVLISTTIVENGIDIPNANTIIIDAAHRFGISVLHQMRGRVGRSDRKAFCYLLAPPLQYLNAESRRRLQAIEDFSDLGSGIHIAMQDLDIRGAGNLLGAEQSGFIADLGYETYQKILAEAIAELRNEAPGDMTAEEEAPTNEETQEQEEKVDQYISESNVECDLHAYFPETYVPGASERMLLYRELDSLTKAEEMEAFRQMLVDRFGTIPQEGEELLRIVPLRQRGKSMGIERIVLQDNKMTLYFVSQKDSPYYRSKTFERIIRYATNHYRRCQLKEPNGKPQMVIHEVKSVEEALATLEKM